jgi:hypothetical protein
MIVSLSTGWLGDDVKTYSKKMPEGKFALRIAQIANEGRLPIQYMENGGGLLAAQFFAVILGRDPKDFPETKGPSSKSFPYSPNIVFVNSVGDKKLLWVRIIEKFPEDCQKHFFFRVHGRRVRPLLCAEGYRFEGEFRPTVYGPEELQIGVEDPMWPWCAFYPERFAGVLELSRTLTPGELNPLSGLLMAKDGAVRTLAKQVANRLKEARKQLIRDVISSL